MTLKVIFLSYDVPVNNDAPVMCVSGQVVRNPIVKGSFSRGYEGPV